MNRRQWIALSGIGAAATTVGEAQVEVQANGPTEIRLKDYRPVSAYKLPTTEIQRAKFPIIDAHCQDLAGSVGVDEAVKLMDKVGLEKAAVFTGAASREEFFEARQRYAKFPDRFDLWCGLDLEGRPNPLKPLSWCHMLGARGVAGIVDNGHGIGAKRIHLDDPFLGPIWNLCGEFGLPVRIQLANPVWTYLPMDASNDGLMNGFKSLITDITDMLSQEQLLAGFERTVANHPGTVFIAGHLLNLDYDLSRLGSILDHSPNVYTDIAARFGEIAAIPRFAARFIERYQDRILYGTGLRYGERMFTTTFRILETEDEHFYAQDLFDYHWPLHGLGLGDDVLKKVYGSNARRVLQQVK
jgi:uncharacterized protein